MAFEASETLCKHTQDERTYYMDFGCAMDAGETISTATVASTDSGMTLGTVSVITSATTVNITKTETHTIAANEGISFAIDGGTIGSWVVTGVVTLSTSSDKIGLSGLIEVNGESA